MQEQMYLPIVGLAAFRLLKFSIFPLSLETNPPLFRSFIPSNQKINV
jgi:hypothetical protein